MKISELIEELQEAEKNGINRVKMDNLYIDKVTCEGVGCYIDLKVSNTYGLTLSELIKELHSMRVGYGSDVEVLAVFDTYGTGEWTPLEDSGVSFDRFNEGKNIVYIGW